MVIAMCGRVYNRVCFDYFIDIPMLYFFLNINLTEQCVIYSLVVSTRH